MARNGALDLGEKISLMRALAFQIHRKRIPVEVMAEYVDERFQHGRRREYRPVQEALDQSGFVGALRALEMIGEEGGLILDQVIENGDHRLTSAILTKLADALDGGA